MGNDALLRMPGAVFYGSDVLKRLSGILEENQAKRLTIFTDKGVRAAGLLELPLTEIHKTKAEVQILDDLPPEPSYGDAQRLIEQCKAFQTDFIIAVGGGSAMDVAKLASILLTDQYGVKELLDTPMLGQKCVKTVMIPTTAGTGAEATPNAIVNVPEKRLKIGIVNPNMMANYVILDGIFIKDLPQKIAASTGIDALSHAIECWTSKKANAFSDTFAMRAMELIFPHIESACNDPEAAEAKEAMLLASFYAGVAITASGTTAVHALSYPLGGMYHIPHGVSNAILLAPVMRMNEPACRELLAVVYDRCIGGGATDAAEKSAAVIQRLEELVEHLDIPRSLKPFGIPCEDLDTLVEAGMSVTRLLVNNRKEVTREDARAIYQALL